MKKFFFNLNRKLKKVARSGFTIFVESEKCLCCGEDCYNIPVCKKCLSQLDSIVPKEKRCKKCGKVLVSEIDVCTTCRENPVVENLEFVFPLYSYRLWKKDLLFEWKLADKRALSDFFAEKISSVLNEYFKDIPIVPVPPRPGKLKKKGWDQIAEISDYLKYSFDHEVLNILKRVNVEQQKKLNREERLSHIDQSYVVNPKTKSFPKEVVLLDDIMTTGATLESCARVLKSAGVEKVYAATVFIAD